MLRRTSDYDWGVSGDELARLMEWADQHNAEPNHVGVAHA